MCSGCPPRPKPWSWSLCPSASGLGDSSASAGISALICPTAIRLQSARCLPPSPQVDVCSGVMRTIERNLHTVSVGCAPTPIQYFARSMSRRMSLCSFPEVSYVSFFGMGSYVPMTSRGLLFRAVLQNSLNFFGRAGGEGKMGDEVIRTLHVRRRCCRKARWSARNGRV